MLLLPFLLLGGQYVLGLPVGLHWFTGALLTVHDGALHSVNPFSVMYFNPIFDWLLEPNVNHQLHHALNKGHYTFVPWEHALSPAKRTADCNRYNQVFKTNFVFARSSLSRSASWTLFSNKNSSSIVGTKRHEYFSCRQ